MCASNPYPTLWEAFRQRTSRLFNRHLRSRSPFCGIYLIFPAHISLPQPTSAQGTIILHFPVDLDLDFRFEFPHIDEVCYSELRVVEKVMERTYKMQVFG